MKIIRERLGPAGRPAVFRSNADPEKTYRRLLRTKEVRSLDKTEKGLISIRFRNPFDSIVLLSPKGTIQTYPTSVRDRKELENFIRKNFASIDGKELWLRLEKMGDVPEEIQKIYDYYNDGHLVHSPFCLACITQAQKKLVEIPAWNDSYFYSVRRLVERAGNLQQSLIKEWVSQRDVSGQAV